MIFLAEIINALNGNFKSKLSNYPTADYFGIATPVAVQRSNSTIVYPSVINIEGSIQGTFFQFQSPFIVYHRLLSTTINNNGSQRFGQDAQSVMVATTTVTLVVMGSREKINNTPENLISRLLDALPGSMDIAYGPGGTIKAITKESSVEYDPRAIFSREFQGIKYFIGPEMFLMAARYTIESTYFKGCLSSCTC